MEQLQQHMPLFTPSEADQVVYARVEVAQTSSVTGISA